MSAAGGFTPPPPRNTVDFSTIGEAFELIKNHFAAFATFAIVGFIPMIVVGVIWYILFAGMIFAGAALDSEAFIFGSFFMSYGLLFIMIYASIGFMYGGLTKMALIAAQGGTPTFQDGMEAIKILLPLTLLGLVFGFATTLGVIACFVGTFVVGGLLMPAFPIMIHERLSVGDAIKRSFELMQQHWLMAGVVYLVTSLISGVAGNCCLLLPFVMPWVVAVFVLVYRDVSGDPMGPTSATVYPRAGGGNMPKYDGPENSDPTPPINDPMPPQE